MSETETSHSNPEWEEFRVERLQKEHGGDDWIWVTFPCTGGRPRNEIVELASITKAKLLARLLEAGADLPPDSERKAFLADLMGRVPAGAGLLTDSPGWKHDAPNRSFVLPNAMFGESGVSVVLTQRAKTSCLATSVGGSLEGWQSDVAALALRSGHASTAILAAFASSLFPFSELREGFILNFAGNGSAGKTTANQAGASVIGDPTRILSWNATVRGLIELAASHNDLLFVLDDAEQADENSKRRLRKVSDATHVIASGSSKNYSKVVSGDDQLPKLLFNCIALSSSPRTIESDAQANGYPRTDGDRARFLEVKVPHGNQGGIWVPYGDGDTPADTAALSDQLSTAAKKNFGHPLRAWVSYLTANQSGLEGQVATLTTEFIAAAAPDAQSVERRIAVKIGLLYAGGCLASGAGVLPWDESEVLAVATYAYRAVILAAFGERFDPRPSFHKVYAAIANSKRLPRLLESDLRSNPDLLGPDGYVSRDKARAYVRLEAIKIATATANGSPLSAADFSALLTALHKNGILLQGHNGGFTRDERVAGKKSKYLVLRVRKLIAFVKAEKARAERHRPSKQVAANSAQHLDAK